MCLGAHAWLHFIVGPFVAYVSPVPYWNSQYLEIMTTGFLEWKKVKYFKISDIASVCNIPFKLVSIASSRDNNSLWSMVLYKLAFTTYMLGRFWIKLSNCCSAWKIYLMTQNNLVKLSGAMNFSQQILVVAELAFT